MERYIDPGWAAAFFIILLLSPVGSPFSSITSGGDMPMEEPPSRSFPEGFSASICNWKDNRTGALSITYDDGLHSQIENASVIMSLLDLQGTFFITIDNVGIPYGATWTEWQTVADDGNEIGSHSKTHPDLRTMDPIQLYEEVVMTKTYIEENLTDVKCQTFSYPMGLYNETIMDLVRQHYISARQDRHNITGEPVPLPVSPDDLYSIVPVDFGVGETAAELNDLVDDTIVSGGWLVEMIHAVGSGGYDPVDLAQFTSHMQYAAGSKEDMWIAPFGDVSKYIRIRDTAKVNMTRPDDHQLDIALETPLNEAEFDVPITLNVSFPGDWIDLEIYRSGIPTIHHTKDGGGHRYIYVELKANESIRIVQANLNPRIDLYEPIPDSGSPFSPLSGDSSQFYWFYLNYTSVVNRPPLERPMVWFDLNGDGDLDDIVNGYQEGGLEMSRMDMSDSDYTDGCIFFIEEIFPPGTDMRIRFSARDSEGLEAVSSTGMGGWKPGPFLNDPPTLTHPPSLRSDHTTRPTFFWEQGADPDGDDIVYRIGLTYLYNGTEIFTHEVASTNFTSDRSLEFFTDYNFSISASDGRGLLSDPQDLHFSLTNEPPPAVEEIFIEYRERLVPTFIIDSPQDPDGDWVTYHIILREMTDDGPVKVHSDHQTRNRTFITDLELKDHTNYTITAYQIDQYDLTGVQFEKEFHCNFPPLPIFGGEVRDLRNEEDGLIVSWYPSEEDDVIGYRVYKFLNEPEDFDPVIAGEVFETTVTSSLIDRNVTDGNTYWYSVAALDLDGEMDTVNVSIFNGTPLDDVAPPPVTDIRVTFQEESDTQTPRMLIEWNESDDPRFLGYRIYRTTGAIEDISGLEPIFFREGNSSNTSTFDPEIEMNTTYYYTVTAVDLSGNELRSGLSWISATYPFVQPPITPDDKDSDGDDRDARRMMCIGASIVVILILLAGISYLGFLLMQRKTNYFDEMEE